MKLVKLLPEFSTELETFFLARGREDIASQVPEVEVECYTYDDSCGALYIYVLSPQQLNVVEANIIGVRHGSTIEVKHRYWVNIDTDNFGRLRGIELLNGSEVAQMLSDQEVSLC
jgi:uncharacterized protein YuzE